MKGQAMDIVPTIESILTALIVLTIVVGSFAGNTTAFTKSAILGVQADRVTNAALLVQSEDIAIRSELSGYNISYRPESDVMVFSFKRREIREDIDMLQGAYGGIQAPRESTKIESYLCITNQNNVLHITVDRCPS